MSVFDMSSDERTTEPQMARTEETIEANSGSAAKAASHRVCGEARPPATPRPGARPRLAVTTNSRASRRRVTPSSLADRIELYRAEREALDMLREKGQEQEEKEDTVEEVMQQVVRDFQRVLIAARVNLAEVFTSFDKDSDGTVTIKEFRAGLRSLKVNVSDEMVEKLVGAMDRDGDGEIDYREFTRQL